VNEHERRALNEALFRDVNERIAESADGFDADRTEFVCECADPNCTDRVPATLAEYESVRKQSTTFLLAPGHHEPEIERVVSDRGGFQVVEKVQAAVRRAVIRLDRRQRPAASQS
jgi:RNA:NAD 2'-phosphotransferase (TPT1/KptA family)